MSVNEDEGVIIIYSSDDETQNASSDVMTVPDNPLEEQEDRHLYSSIAFPQIQDVSQLEKCIISSQVDCENDIHHEKTLVYKQNDQSKQNTQNNFAHLENLPKEFMKVVSDTKKENYLLTENLSNIEKTILEVSKSDFDISGLVTLIKNKRNRTISQEISFNGSTKEIYQQPAPTNESQNLRVNKGSPQFKSSRGRPRGWRKNNNNFNTSVIKAPNRKGSCNLKNTDENYMDDAFSIMQPINKKIRTNNSNTSSILEDNAMSSFVVNEGARRSKQEQLQTGLGVCEFINSNSNVNDDSLKVPCETSNSENVETLGCVEKVVDQEKDRLYHFS